MLHSLPYGTGSVTIARVANYIGAIDQGTTSTRFMRVRPAGKIVAVGAERTRADLSAAGMGGARSQGNLAAHAGCDCRGARAAQPSCRPIWRPSASPTSARPRWCGIGRPASPCPTPWSGRTRAVDDDVAELARDGGADRFRAKTGLPLSTYFSGLKIRWMLDQCAGRAHSKPKPAKYCSATSTPF